MQNLVRYRKTTALHNLQFLCKLQKNIYAVCVIFLIALSLKPIASKFISFFNLTKYYRRRVFFYRLLGKYRECSGKNFPDNLYTFNIEIDIQMDAVKKQDNIQ